jgi:hypothetical protein
MTSVGGSRFADISFAASAPVAPAFRPKAAFTTLAHCRAATELIERGLERIEQSLVSVSNAAADDDYFRIENIDKARDGGGERCTERSQSRVLAS